MPVARIISLNILAAASRNVRPAREKEGKASYILDGEGIPVRLSNI